MSTLNKIVLKEVSTNDVQLSKVIKFSIGNADAQKMTTVIESYNNANNKLVGAYIIDRLIAIIGLKQESSQLIIRHLSVMPEFQNQGIGKLLLNEVKKQYIKYKIMTETDEESVTFYLKCGFTCHSFQGKYNNLRYACECHKNYQSNS